MNKLFILIVSVFALGAVGLVYQASQEGTALVLQPSELLAKSGSSHSINRIRVAGRIAPGAIDYVVEPQIELRFAVHDPNKDHPGESIPVVYNGLRPDMFAAGRDVIIDGDFKSGVLYANKLLTQCPSKYEAPDPQKMYDSSNPAQAK